MKKLISLSGAIMIAGIMFSSCNKDYSCKCYFAGTLTDSYDVRASNKNKAEDECNEKRTVAGVTRECRIEN